MLINFIDFLKELTFEWTTLSRSCGYLPLTPVMLTLTLMLTLNAVVEKAASPPLHKDFASDSASSKWFWSQVPEYWAREAFKRNKSVTKENTIWMMITQGNMQLEE